jgi:hypothetical protein
VIRRRSERPGFDSRRGQPPIYLVTGTLSPGIKRPWHEADHSPESSAEVKNAWSYAATPSTRLHDVVLSYEGISESIRTGRPEREVQMVQLSATGCSCIDIL